MAQGLGVQMFDLGQLAIVRRTIAFLVVVLSLGLLEMKGANWGKEYFPNTLLQTHEGKSVRFFDDLVEDKIVVINFIYTTCPDTCPLETAQLTKVQEILGDRLGKDLFFYSITIDPDNDTPSVLREYRERFGARWTFLTGDEEEIVRLRKKLGLFIPEIQDGSSNHNVNMIIGNQKTGRWMKRSPFENPYILADQIGHWLDGWKRPPQWESYLNAPKLRDLPQGEQLFRTRCASCHSIDGNQREGALGPDLLNVDQRRDQQWLLRWLQAPDRMLAEGDPIATALLKQYNNLAMPNLRLSKEEGLSVLSFLKEESERVMKGKKILPRIFGRQPSVLSKDSTQNRPIALSRESRPDDVLAVMNAWIRATDAKARVNAGYLTLVNVKKEDVELVHVECSAFREVQIHEMSRKDGMMRMRRLKSLKVPSGDVVQLKPGGLHLMLMGPKRHLKTGESVEVTLQFSGGAEQRLLLGVEDR